MNGVKFQREFFCSHPAEVLAAQFTADKKGAYTGSIELARCSRRQNRCSTATGFTASGTLDNGLKFEWQVLVLNQGRHGSGVADQLGRSLNSRTATASRCWSRRARIMCLIMRKIITATDPHARVTAQLDAAAKQNFASLEAEHIKDYQALFNRVSADFGQSSAAQTSLPTDKRKLEAFKTVDPGLEALLFQYGRYLLISCSRPGGLPANLQGLVERQQQPAVAQRLSREHQHPDELLARRSRQSRRMPHAVV